MAAAVGALTTILERLRNDLAGWRTLEIADLVFARRSDALNALIVLTALAAGVLLWRLAADRARARQLVLPALVRLPAARLRWLRHLPMVLALAALPCFAVALADPLEAVTRKTVSYPGRRIALLIDASSSMMTPFDSAQLRDSSSNNAAFLTTIAAAETFVNQRKAGRYRDFISVIEFGDEAYVITPFTTDYDNALLSISLIGDWGEYMRFPDGGTAIARGIDQATALFKAFDFLDAAGNVMVIFSDGEDTQVASRGKRLQDVLAGAVAARIPVYLVRTSSGKRLGDVVPDAIWKPAVEATGGRFYAAAQEADILRAIRDIDARSNGTIDVNVYATREPRFVGFALLAAALWAAALILKTTIPFFTRFP
jgi:hypothetical protein